MQERAVHNFLSVGGRHVELILGGKKYIIICKKKDFQYEEECLAQLYNMRYSCHVNTKTSTQNV
jgi:hypothetical protein